MGYADANFFSQRVAGCMEFIAQQYLQTAPSTKKCLIEQIKTGLRHGRITVTLQMPIALLVS